MSGKLAALNAPLAFEPGERWEYGINIDWAGRMVETVSGQDLEAYMRENIFAPLGMRDTGFVPNAEQFARCAQAHARNPDGSLEPVAADAAGAHPSSTPVAERCFPPGPDYLTFLRMLLNGGTLNGARILQARDRRADGAEPHRRSERAEHDDAAARDIERCRVVPRHGEEMGP